MSAIGLIWLHLMIFAGVAAGFHAAVVILHVVSELLVPALRRRFFQAGRPRYAAFCRRLLIPGGLLVRWRSWTADSGVARCCAKNRAETGPPVLHWCDGLPGRTHPAWDFMRRVRTPRSKATGWLLGMLLLTASAQAGDRWPTFQNGGQVSFAEAEVGGDGETAWSVEIVGYGQSSPVVWDGRAYVTSVSGANQEKYHVSAYRLTDGEKLWQHDVPNPTPRENNNYVSKAASTPAADHDGVICFLEGGNLLAFTHDGDVRWERNLVDDYGPIESNHGLAASVEQSEETAFVWVERDEEPYLLAVAKRTGETRWKVPGIGATSWASPRLIPVADGRHLVLSGIGKLVGLDPENGQELWTLDGISGNSVPTPMPLGDGRFLIGATEGRGEASGGRAAESNGVVAVRKREDGTWHAGFDWRAERAISSFGSPICHAGHAYFVNRSGVVYCLDIATGEERYAQRLAGSVWATPIARGERIYFFAKEGIISTLAAGAVYRSLGDTPILPDSSPPEDDQDRVAGPTLYAAVVAGNRLLVRTGDRLLCLEP